MTPEAAPGGFRVKASSVVLAAAVLVLLGAALGHLTAQPARPAAAATAIAVPRIPAPAPAPLVIADVTGPLSAVLSDLRAADRHQQEAWVTAGYSNDLAVLTGLTDDADGTNPLNVNARVFSTDAYAYLAAHNPVLGDWREDYAQVREDLNTLAADCGLKPVPAPDWLRTGD